MLTDYLSYAEAQTQVSSNALWELFDGNRERLNIAHECVDRHATTNQPAILIAYADGRDERLSFKDLSRLSSQFAHYLKSRGVGPGDRVAVMLEPSPAFYVGVFGAIKLGAVAVPLFTLFGPDGFRLRVGDCKPRVLLTTSEKSSLAQGFDLQVVLTDENFFEELSHYPESFVPNTSANDLAVLQYTSGTTRELPEAVHHPHRAIVTLMLAALYGTGIRPGDRFFCPSSPAWGHGLWHGTFAPLTLGVQTGAYSGRFSAERLLKALQDFEITNLSAAATHYRMMRLSGVADQYHYALEKLSYTGEPIDSETLAFIDATFKRPVCSMYGTTEIGVILVNYPGAPDFKVKPGSLGKPIPNVRVEVQNADGKPTPPNKKGELKVWREGKWIPTKDLGWIDDDGYFYHAGRADDVIISAGWTISAVEVEDAILKHPDVREAAVVGVPDPVRGQVIKAFVVSGRRGGDEFVTEIQDCVRLGLSQHEYPRQIEFVDELPKSAAGKINRKLLRDRIAAASVQ